VDRTTASTTTTVALNDTDRIAGAAVRWRVLMAEDPEQPYATVQSIDRWRTGGASRFGEGIPASTRLGIEEALAPRTVKWVTPEEADAYALDSGSDTTTRQIPIVEVGTPTVDGNTATVEAGISCGNLCGYWGRAVLEKGIEGAWAVTGTDGPQGIA